MTRDECLEIYLRAKIHFKNAAFNYFSSKKPNTSGHKQRTDGVWFSLLLKAFPERDRLEEFLFSNFYHNPNFHPRDFQEDQSKDNFARWLKFKANPRHCIETDLSKLDLRAYKLGLSKKDMFYPTKTTTMPWLLSQLMSEVIMPESLLAIDEGTGAFARWDEMLSFDRAIWPDLKLRLLKYRAFVERRVMLSEHLNIIKTYLLE